MRYIISVGWQIPPVTPTINQVKNTRQKLPHSFERDVILYDNRSTQSKPHIQFLKKIYNKNYN
jgi:hypothetical protein